MIIEKNNQLWTTSLDIAEKFGKRHDAVIRAVENLDIPEDFKQRDFSLLSHQVLGGTQNYYMISFISIILLE